MQTIGLMAAMHDEIRPFLRLAGPATRDRSGTFPLWRLRIGNSDIFIVESGMGIARAAAAADALVAEAAPTAIISFGFGGAVLPGLSVGDIVVGTKSWFADTNGFIPRSGIDLKLARKIAGELDHSVGGACSGEIITSAQILGKGNLAHSLPAGITSPVLDMETAAVAEVAHRHGIPLVALRAISDDAAEELAFSLDEFTDRDLTIRPLKVFATIARKPWIIPQLVRLARNSRIAGKRLAQGVLATVEFLANR